MSMQCVQILEVTLSEVQLNFSPGSTRRRFGRFVLRRHSNRTDPPLSRRPFDFLIATQMGTCPVSVYTYVHERQINAGADVVGKVYLFVKEGINATNLTLRICGQERVEVSYDDVVLLGKESRASTRKAAETQVFLEAEYAVAMFDPQCINKGQYEFPFTFIIPKGVPSSMMAVTGFQDKCSVSYYMEALLKDHLGTVLARSKRIITVVDSYQECAVVPRYLGPSISPLIACCCVSSGNIMLAGCTTASILNTLDEVTVKFAAKHAPNVRIRYIEVTLREIVAFQAKGYHGKGLTCTLYSKKIPPKEDNANSKLSDQIEATTSHTADEDAETANLRVLYKMLELGGSRSMAVRFQIPSTARSSFHGRCITVRHVLSIRVVTPQGSVDPTVSTSVVVRSAHPDQETLAIADNPANNAFVAVPTIWRPVVAPSLNLGAVVMRTPADPQTPEGKTPLTPTEGGGAVVGDSARQRKFRSLLAVVKGSYTPCYELEKWLQSNALDDIDEDQIHALFRAVGFAPDQLELAGRVAEALERVSCKLVARAAEACKPECRREIVEKLLAAGPVTDKVENASLLAKQLTPFEWVTVEKYLL